MESKKSRKEFCIYIKNGMGTPYIQAPYRTFEEALIALNNMVSFEEERNRFYYVDNDFFNNKYPPNTMGKYFCIKERCVEEWEKYEKYKVDSKGKSQNGKIIMFRQQIS